MNLIEVVAKNARMYPTDTALVEIRPSANVRKKITWDQFYERMNRLANGLLDRGITRKDKVYLLGRNSINWLEAFFGIMATGAWVVPLNFRFTDDDIRYCANVAEPALFITEREYAPRIASMGRDLPSVRSFICMDGPFDGMEEMSGIIGKASSEPPPIEIDYCDECALYFTSGTTGAPKPVLHRQMMLVGSAINEATNEGWTHEKSLLMMPPLYHLAIGHLLGCILAGGRGVLLVDKIIPRYIFEAVSTERITNVFLLVPWVQDILAALDKGELKREDYDLSCWSLMYMGAQPIPPALVWRWKEYFPEMAYDETYALSEAGGPGVTHLGPENEKKIGAIGKPGLLWDVRIVDERSVDVAPEEVGELVVRGPGVMKEYYKNPELTAATIRDGWLYTGDLGKIDEDGFITIVDRKKDLVISGGENIYPVEIEAIIQKHPKVYDVAVIGVPDERLGEVVAAIITPVSGETLSINEITEYCRQNLPRYKRPRHFFFSQVPRSATGKIQKPKLRDAYSKGHLKTCS